MARPAGSASAQSAAAAGVGRGRLGSGSGVSPQEARSFTNGGLHEKHQALIAPLRRVAAVPRVPRSTCPGLCEPRGRSVGGHEGVRNHPRWLFAPSLGDERCRHPARVNENEHGDQASLPPRKAHLEDEGAGGRTDLRLSGLRENARQAATVANGRLQRAVAAWNRLARRRWLATCGSACR
jgi:hypothetical protein